MKLDLKGYGQFKDYDASASKKKDGLRPFYSQKSIYGLNKFSITPQNNYALSAAPSFGGFNAVQSAQKALNRVSKFDNFDATIKNIDVRLNGHASELLKAAQSNKALTITHDLINDVGVFTDKSALRKVADGALYPFKNLFLDLGNTSLKALKSIPVLDKSKGINKIYESGLLSKRRDEKAAMYSFYSLKGMMGKYAEGKDPKTAIQGVIEHIIFNLKGDKGNFEVKSERGLNRLATGLVSATFVGRDFYNISRLQHDDDAMAKKTADRRKKQEVTRVGLMAFLTFITLGAFSKQSNSNKYLATAIIVSSTLIAEISARLVNGTSLIPLSPAGAKRRRDKLVSTGKMADKTRQSTYALAGTKPLRIDGVEGFMNSLKNGQMKNLPLARLQFKGDDEKPYTIKDYEGEKTKTRAGFKVAIASVATFMAASMAYVLVSAKNKKLSDFNAKFVETFKAVSEKILKKDFYADKKQMDDILKTMEERGYAKMVKEDKELMRTNKILPIAKKADGESEYYKLGRTNNALSTPVSFVTYPVKFLWEIISYPAKKVNTFINKNTKKASQLVSKNDNAPQAPRKILRLKKNARYVRPNGVKFPSGKITIQNLGENKIFRAARTNKSDNVSSETLKRNEDALQALYKTFDKKMKLVKAGKLSEKDFNTFMKDTFNKTFNNENFSQQSTKSLASFSRVFVTLVTSYFFINDYRNQVLIESNGEDTQRAQEVTKERVMQKFTNLILNSMFMMLFNTTFARPLNSGLLGATAVAAATEMTNESAVRLVIGTPIEKMSKEELLEHEKENYYEDGMKGKWFRAVSTLMGKKPLTEKAKQE